MSSPRRSAEPRPAPLLRCAATFRRSQPHNSALARATSASPTSDVYVATLDSAQVVGCRSPPTTCRPKGSTSCTRAPGTPACCVLGVVQARRARSCCRSTRAALFALSRVGPAARAGGGARRRRRRRDRAPARVRRAAPRREDGQRPRRRARRVRPRRLQRGRARDGDQHRDRRAGRPAERRLLQAVCGGHAAVHGARAAALDGRRQCGVRPRVRRLLARHPHVRGLGAGGAVRGH